MVNVAMDDTHEEQHPCYKTKLYYCNTMNNTLLGRNSFINIQIKATVQYVCPQQDKHNGHVIVCPYLVFHT
jgi:hypothetical protein